MLIEAMIEQTWFDQVDMSADVAKTVSDPRLHCTSVQSMVERICLGSAVASPNVPKGDEAIAQQDWVRLQLKGVQCVCETGMRLVSMEK